MTTCNPCDQAASLTAGGAVEPTCAAMLADSVSAYNAVRRAMMSGKTVIEVRFGEETVKYAATTDTVKFLLDDIRRLNQSCPSETARAILGLGGDAGPLSTRYGSRCS